MWWFDTVLNGAFALEALLKILWFGPKMYLRDTWNRLDLFIVIAGLTVMG